MKIVITQPVEHDGKALAVDETVDLAKDAALALIKAGAAVDPKAKAEAPAEEQPQA